MALAAAPPGPRPLRAVLFDAGNTPGASTESARIHDRYLRYVLEGLGIASEAQIAALARWRREFNLRAPTLADAVRLAVGAARPPAPGP